MLTKTDLESAADSFEAALREVMALRKRFTRLRNRWKDQLGNDPYGFAEFAAHMALRSDVLRAALHGVRVRLRLGEFRTP